MKKKQKRIIFCPNQITVTVSVALTRRDGNVVDTTIIYWPDRCDITSLEKMGTICIPYSRWVCLTYFIRNFWCSNIEVVLPHRKLGRIMNWFSCVCSTTSLIDDGLDTLREDPRNVDPEHFAAGARFYTFKYEIPLGIWLNRFTLERVADIDMLADMPLASISVSQAQRLIIESPPLDRVRSEIGLDEDGSILVTHSNINKRTFRNFSGCSVNGRDIALERSLRDFSGEIVVGESMVAVFALMQDRPMYQIIICLAKENIKNLAPLVRLINSRKFAKLKIC
jgi:hypothetical protein